MPQKCQKNPYARLVDERLQKTHQDLDPIVRFQLELASVGLLDPVLVLGGNAHTTP